MKYERRSAVIEAVQVNKLADADTIIRDCQHVVGVNDVWVFSEGDKSEWYIRFHGTDTDHLVYFGDYLVWDDKGAKSVAKDRFEKKYRPAWQTSVSIYSNPNILPCTTTTNTQLYYQDH